MPKFLIEVPHDSEPRSCIRAVEVFLRTGSHFLTHADWGCKDGEHKAWLIIEVGTRDEARSIVPAEFRGKAKVVALNSFSREDLEKTVRQHGA